MTKEIRDLQARVKELEANYTKRMLSIVKQEHQVKALRDTLDISHQLNDKLREENKGLLKACDSFNAENKELEAQLASKGKVVAEFKAKAYTKGGHVLTDISDESRGFAEYEYNFNSLLTYTVTITEGK